MHQFLLDHREELLARIRAKVRARQAPQATAEELDHGVPRFLTQLGEALRRDLTDASPSHRAIDATALLHGNDLQRSGFTIGQVVHDYGDVCQSITELALDQGTSFTTVDFRILNRCLDDAIAGAVSEWHRQRVVVIASDELERLAVLAHEQRNLLGSAMLAFQMLRQGRVGVNSNTAAVLGRSLERLRRLNSGSLAVVRLNSGLQTPVRVVVAELIVEEEVAASLEAAERKIALIVDRPPYGLAVVADHMILGAALANLLQNAMKFTRQQGKVILRVRNIDGRVLIDVEDECGGLPPEHDLFRTHERRGADKTGFGLGLTIARHGVENNGGKLVVRDLPGRGCVFTIDLPIAPEVPASSPVVN